MISGGAVSLVGAGLVYVAIGLLVRWAVAVYIDRPDFTRQPLFWYFVVVFWPVYGAVMLVVFLAVTRDDDG